MIIDKNLIFCDEYKYPDIVKKQLLQILNLILPFNPLSVILLGSSVKGELAYRMVKEDIRIYSDYDIVVFLNKGKMKDGIEIEKLLSRFNLSLTQVRLAPKVDFNFFLKNELKRFPLLQYTYNLKYESVVIFGDDIRRFLPSVTLEKIDLELEKEYIICALWEMLAYMPQDLFLGRYSVESAYEDYKYLISSRFLNVVSKLLFIEGFKINSIRDAVDFIKKEHKKLKFIDYMSNEFIDFLTVLTDVKYHLKFDIEVKALYIKTIDCIADILKYWMFGESQKNISKEDLVFVLMNNRYHVFGGLNIKSKFKNTISLFKKIPLSDFKIKFFLDYVNKRPYLLTSLLLNFHISLVEFWNRASSQSAYSILNKYCKLRKDFLGDDSKDAKLLIEYKRSIEKIMYKLLPYKWIIKNWY